MIVWITGEKDKAEEKRLAEAIAGAFVKGVVLHGEEFIEEFKLPGVEGKFNSKIASRLIITAKILAKQDCLVVIAHTVPLVVIAHAQRLYSKAIPVIIDQPIHEAIKKPYVYWNRGDRVTDRDDLVETILRELKKW